MFGRLAKKLNINNMSFQTKSDENYFVILKQCNDITGSGMRSAITITGSGKCSTININDIKKGRGTLSSYNE
jgi:hypothetical protein